MAIGEDVRGVQQLEVSKAAYCAMLLICPDHAGPESSLVQALLSQPRDVCPPRRGDIRNEVRCFGDLRVLQIHRHREGKRRRVVVHDEDRPDRQILASNNSEEVDERSSAPHRESQSRVVPMIRIDPAIAVEKEPVLVHLVLVGSLPPLDDRHGRDSQRHLGQDRRLEDALRPDQRSAPPLELESLGEKPPR